MSPVSIAIITIYALSGDMAQVSRGGWGVPDIVTALGKHLVAQQ